MTPSKSVYCEKHPYLYDLCPLCGEWKRDKSKQCGVCRKGKRKSVTQPEDDSYRLIPLTKGQFSLIDTSDYEKLSIFVYHAVWDKDTKSYYAMRNSKSINGKRHNIRMHSDVMGLLYGDKRTVDHINHDTLDNRRQNLRIANQSEQSRNTRLSKANTSGVKGVSFNKITRKWIAYITVYRKRKNLGTFVTKEKAAQARCAAEIEIHGEFAFRL